VAQQAVEDGFVLPVSRGPELVIDVWVIDGAHISLALLMKLLTSSASLLSATVTSPHFLASLTNIARSNRRTNRSYLLIDCGELRMNCAAPEVEASCGI